MVKALLLAAAFINCSVSRDVEIEGKLYNYAFSSEETITLETKDKTYNCTFDRPYTIGPGVKTITRYKCGQIVVFTQVLLETCTRSDYNPNPDDFYRSADYGRKLLRIQHGCMEDGLKMTGSWTKLRDRSGEEWRIEQSFSGRLSTSKCSSKAKVDKYIQTYKIERTGDVVRIVETTINPVESVREKKAPLL